MACSIVTFASFARSATLPSLSSLHAVPANNNTRLIATVAESPWTLMSASLCYSSVCLSSFHVRRSGWCGAAFMRTALHGPMRAGHAAAVTPAALFMLLHDLLVLGLFLRALLGSQQRQYVPARLDGGHPQRHLQIFTLSQLCLNRAEIGLLFIGQRLQLTLRDLDVGFRLDACLVEVQLYFFELRHLVGRQADVFLVFEKMADQMPAALVHHAHAMAAHCAVASASIAVFSAAMAVARFVGPDSGRSHRQEQRPRYSERQPSSCPLLHAILLQLEYLVKHYHTNKPPSPFSPLNRN